MKLYRVKIEATVYVVENEEESAEQVAIDLFGVDGITLMASARECRPGDTPAEGCENDIPFNTTNETRTVSKMLADMTDAEKGEIGT